MGSNPIFRSDRLGTRLVLIIGGGPPGGRTNVCGGSIPSPSAFVSLVEAVPKDFIESSIRDLLAFIHRVSESLNSRKLPLRIVQPYAVGPGQKRLQPRSSTPKSRHLATPTHKDALVVSEKTTLLGSWVCSGILPSL
jgi:hypothetical protein